MNAEKEAIQIWKETYPILAYIAGLKQYAGQIWIPSHHNKKNTLARIQKIEKKADEVTKKFLKAIKRDLMFEEPHRPPGEILDIFFAHLILEGIKEKRILTLAEQSINLLAVQEETTNKKWPIEIQIFTIQQCDGAKAILETIKKKTKGETKQALTALQKRIEDWKNKTTKLKLKTKDYKEIYPILQKKSKGLGRKKTYNSYLKDLYDYTETPEQIEQLAVKWIEQELPEFNKIINKLARKYKCKPTAEEIDKAIKKHQAIPLKKLIPEIKKLRKTLQKVAEKEWVKITPKYNVKLIETPSYLVPFMPTGAMQAFGALGKPHCLFYTTTDPRASPPNSLPDAAQIIIHEEYGHCVNFMNICTSKNRKIEIIESTLCIPITEGLSFYRELESVKTFEKKTDKEAKKEIEKYVPYKDFVDAEKFVVMHWRMGRFLRAVSDSRLNREVQTFPEFIEWAHKKTGLSKKAIFDLIFHFQRMPGYAPTYSIFGQKLKEYQAKAIKKGYTQKEFNTYVASSGFPARSIFERRLRKKFKLS
ncbi:DUF885 family protein [Candidatus Woesearchaeota archaeon]|nr:DUF885 family protein [Candidatus Woesearchaeota archaeon]